jgi:hypothetical protein
MDSGSGIRTGVLVVDKVSSPYRGAGSGIGRRIEGELSGYFSYWWPCDSGNKLRNKNRYLLSSAWKGRLGSMYFLFSSRRSTFSNDGTCNRGRAGCDAREAK